MLLRSRRRAQKPHGACSCQEPRSKDLIVDGSTPYRRARESEKRVRPNGIPLRRLPLPPKFVQTDKAVGGGAFILKKSGRRFFLRIQGENLVVGTREDQGVNDAGAHRISREGVYGRFFAGAESYMGAWPYPHKHSDLCSQINTFSLFSGVLELT